MCLPLPSSRSIPYLVLGYSVMPSKAGQHVKTVKWGPLWMLFPKVWFCLLVQRCQMGKNDPLVSFSSILASFRGVLCISSV